MVRWTLAIVAVSTPLELEDVPSESWQKVDLSTTDKLFKTRDSCSLLQMVKNSDLDIMIHLQKLGTVTSVRYKYAFKTTANCYQPRNCDDLGFLTGNSSKIQDYDK